MGCQTTVFFLRSPPRPLPSVPSPSFRLAQGNSGRTAEGREHTERCCQKKILLESVREDFLQRNQKEKKNCMGSDWLEAHACVIEVLLVVSCFAKTKKGENYFGGSLSSISLHVG